MTDSPPRNGASLLRTAALGFVTSVVLILIGYWLNSWLSRDHLSIEYVRFIPSTQAQFPLTELERKLHQLRSYPNYEISVVSPAPCNLSSTFPPFRDVAGLTLADVRSFQNCLERFADDNKLTGESIRKLQSDLDKNPPLDPILVRWANLFSFSLLDPNIRVLPERKLQEAKREVKAAISNSAEADRVYGELLELVKQIKIIRNGNLTIVTTIRNSGDTDSLVMAVPENSLILNKNPARLPIRLLGMYTWNPTSNPQFANTVSVVSIPKRGAVTISFLLDPSVLPEPPRVAISELLKQSQYGDLRGKVILKDTRNSDFESKEFDFPPGPEE